MPEFSRIVIIQTAFLGDVILALPLAQVVKKMFPSALIDMVVVPSAGKLLTGHPAIHEVITYDKRGIDSGINGFIRMAARLRPNRYDIAFIPHRSLRSAALARLSDIPIRVGFDKRPGKYLNNGIVHYDSKRHEIERNLSLLEGVGVHWSERELPSLYPSNEDCTAVETFLQSKGISQVNGMVAVAPGTVWKTKQWPPERFQELIRKICAKHISVLMVGGIQDGALCEEIVRNVQSPLAISSAGIFSLLRSAELIRRCSLLVCNDSAPLHIAVAMRTPVVAIFGATIPEFGFAPYGVQDVVVETMGLSCRPCSIHGGQRCPITTFDCMMNISPEQVLDQVLTIFKQS